MTSQSFLLYTLKISCLSGIFVGYYWLALRNKRFHYFNRFYLLASVTMSLIIPILRFDWITNEKPVFMGSGEAIDIIISSTNQQTNRIGIWDICLLVMILTSLLLIGMIAYHIYKIYRLKKQSQIIKMNGFDLMQTDEESAPFSFLDNLFWKRSIAIEDEGGRQIFKHELTHIQQKHTWDRLFTQLSCSIFWINPFYWIIQNELETIHEFIADEAAVANQNVESFAKMLLQAHFGNHFLETKHSFFYSSIKRRLTMLTTTNNIRFSYLRRVMLLPLLLTAISFFSVRVQAKEKIENKMTAISESIFQKKIDTTKPPPTPTVKPKFINGKKVVSSSKVGDNTVIKFEDGTTQTIKFVEGHKIEYSKKQGNQSLQQDPFEKVFTVTQEEANFPGGKGEWLKYLEQNLNRDKPVEKGAPVGHYKVNLNFIVDKEGDIRDVVAENNPGYFTKDEAIRVILSSPKWTPAKQNGKAVISRVKKSITFVVSEE